MIMDEPNTSTPLQNSTSSLRMKSTFSTQDEQFMEEALNMARKALNEFEVPVGCVITYENNIIGRGYNKTNQTKNVRVVCVQFYC